MYVCVCVCVYFLYICVWKNERWEEGLDVMQEIRRQVRKQKGESHVFFSCLIHALIFSAVTSSSTAVTSTSSSGRRTNMAAPSAIGSFNTPTFTERSYAKKYLSARNIMGTMTT